MAFIRNQTEEEYNEDGTLANPVSYTGGQDIAPTSAETQSAVNSNKPQSSGTFTNLQKYLQANSSGGMNVANKVSDYIQTKGTEAEAGIAPVKSQFEGAVQQGTKVWNPSGDMNQQASTGYTGPENFAAFQPAVDLQKKVQKASEVSTLAKTPEGRTEIMRDIYNAAPNPTLTTTGGLNLNQMFMQNTAPAFEKVNQAAQATGAVGGKFNTLADEMQQKVKAGQETSNATRNQALARLSQTGQPAPAPSPAPAPAPNPNPGFVIGPGGGGNNQSVNEGIQGLDWEWEGNPATGGYTKKRLTPLGTVSTPPTSGGTLIPVGGLAGITGYRWVPDGTMGPYPSVGSNTPAGPAAPPLSGTPTNPTPVDPLDVKENGVSDREIKDYISAQMNNPNMTDADRRLVITQAMAKYGVDENRLARATGYTVEQIRQYLFPHAWPSPSPAPSPGFSVGPAPAPSPAPAPTPEVIGPLPVQTAPAPVQPAPAPAPVNTDTSFWDNYWRDYYNNPVLYKDGGYVQKYADGGLVQSLEKQILDRWGAYGDWKSADQNQAQDLARLLAANGITDISKLQFTPREYKATTQGFETESGYHPGQEISGTTVDVLYDGKNLGYLGDINRDGSLGKLAKDRNNNDVGIDPVVLAMGGSGTTTRGDSGSPILGWSAAGGGHTNFSLVQDPKTGQYVVAPTWGSSSQGDRQAALTAAAIIAGGAYAGLSSAGTAAAGTTGATQAGTTAATTAGTGGINWGAVGQGALKGAALNTGSALLQGKDFDDALKSGAIGAVTGGLGAGLSSSFGWNPVATGAATGATGAALRGGDTRDILLGGATGALGGYTSTLGLPQPVGQLVNAGGQYLLNKEFGDNNTVTNTGGNTSTGGTNTGGTGGNTGNTPAGGQPSVNRQASSNQSRSLLDIIEGIKTPEMMTLTNKDGMLMSGLYGVEKARGGAIHGPGGPKDDMIPARLSDGEYVIQASAVEKLGKNLLDYLNSLGDK